MCIDRSRLYATCTRGPYVCTCVSCTSRGRLPKTLQVAVQYQPARSAVHGRLPSKFKGSMLTCTAAITHVYAQCVVRVCVTAAGYGSCTAQHELIVAGIKAAT